MTPKNSSSCFSYRPKNTATSWQRGFTLIEILVALGVIAMILSVVYPIFDGMIRFGQKAQTRSSLQTAAQALKSAYRVHAMTVDSHSGAEVCLDAGCSAAIKGTSSDRAWPSATATATADGSTTAKALTQIAREQGLAQAKLDIDGYAKHFVYFVSKRMSANYGGPGGYPLYYHVIAVVSSEGHNRLSPGTSFNPKTGQLRLAADNLGVVVSGLPIQRDMMKQTLQSLHHVANAYGQFFTASYLGSSSRNLSVDYFSRNDCPNDCQKSNQFDAASPIGNSGNNEGAWSFTGWPYPGVTDSRLTDFNAKFKDCQPASVLKGFQSTLGMPTQELDSAWGYPLGVCNGPNADGQGGHVRNPASNDATLTTPPFTAEIVAWAPGEVPLQVSVTGQY